MRRQQEVLKQVKALAAQLRANTEVDKSLAQLNLPYNCREEQGQSDSVLEDLACMLGCTRSSLHVVASEKGVVVGRLTFREDGDFIDCQRMGVGGKAIPPNMDKVTDITSDAAFILLVEKDAAFMRLAEDRFYNTYPCIILTAKGQPDVATRQAEREGGRREEGGERDTEEAQARKGAAVLFLRKLKTTLKIPVLALVDSDPYGLKILSVYMKGSMAMSYDSSNLTTPDIKWLGVRPSDLDRFAIPEQCRLPMTEEDIKTGKRLLNIRAHKNTPHATSRPKAASKSSARMRHSSISSTDTSTTTSRSGTITSCGSDSRSSASTCSPYRPARLAQAVGEVAALHAPQPHQQVAVQRGGTAVPPRAELGQLPPATDPGPPPAPGGEWPPPPTAPAPPAAVMSSAVAASARRISH
ncbi:DNA topoisomerase 6 subunit A [Tetrabaena socialis]|uniref:DNA topoisomerase 6 subunit A n=1 Tax=Tetrabaena socialis TaxID=47790 RepID=A0A2J8A9R8_9CHLO|nr:DNA topoisomerase 6 subunit A [Tetrabaena socialis]|eukprot:PNH09266.1 DNA topoisomerase 6 subunit A [Tetrabaena socialis]